MTLEQKGGQSASQKKEKPTDVKVSYTAVNKPVSELDTHFLDDHPHKIGPRVDGVPTY
jgi:hypothetical protein